jgi:hypothetical protein
VETFLEDSQSPIPIIQVRNRHAMHLLTIKVVVMLMKSLVVEGITVGVFEENS